MPPVQRAVTDRTTGFYQRVLKQRLDPLPIEYAIPAEAFNRYLDTMPATVVPPQAASLDEVLQAGDARGCLPMRRCWDRSRPSTTVPARNPHRIAARRGRERGKPAAGFTGAAWRRNGRHYRRGRFLGVSITVGAGIWGMLEYDQARSVIEAQLRKNPDAALETVWQGLVQGPQGGVSAVVHHISQQIEHRIALSLQAPPA